MPPLGTMPSSTPQLRVAWSASSTRFFRSLTSTSAMPPTLITATRQAWSELIRLRSHRTSQHPGRAQSRGAACCRWRRPMFNFQAACPKNRQSSLLRYPSAIGAAKNRSE